MEPFEFKEKPIPHFELSVWKDFLPSISSGFSTRQGGQSTGNFQTLNLALHVGDNEEDVITNRKKITSILGFSYDAWTSANQVHGNHVEIITLEERGKGRFKLEDSIPNADSIVTNQVDILLTSFYADCVPLYFFDPVKQVIGLAHAGWKGTVLKIGEQMTAVMTKSFGSELKNIKVAIGPSIGQCCYEVNDNVISQLGSAIPTIPDKAIIPKEHGHFALDLKKVNQQILFDAGILPENIEITNLCTSCNQDLFFSYRRDQGNTGRMISWIGLRKDE